MECVVSLHFLMEFFIEYDLDSLSVADFGSNCSLFRLVIVVWKKTFHKRKRHSFFRYITRYSQDFVRNYGTVNKPIVWELAGERLQLRRAIESLRMQ